VTREALVHAVLQALLLPTAASALAEGYFCSVDTVCSHRLPCYRNEYVWDMHLTETEEGWVVTYEPDDGSRDLYQPLAGAGAGEGLFLSLMRREGEDRSATLFTIRPDLGLVLTTHFTGDTPAETAFGRCEVAE